MQLSFGSGALIGTQTSDAYGTPIANPTPVQFGVLQNASLDVSFDVKELYGQGQFPVAVGRGKGKIACKAAFAQLNGLVLNTMVFGQTLATGTIGQVVDVVGAAVPASPNQITATPPSGASWVRDLGVRNSNGVALRCVGSAPASGQYAVAAGGVYTFASADAGNTVYVSYQYTATSATGQRSTIVNVPMGSAPFFRADLMLNFGGKQSIWSLPSCMSHKLALATKLDDFTMPDFEFAGFADSFGNVLTYSTAE